MASGSGKKTTRNGVKKNRSKVQEEDSWFEEEDDDDNEGMETESDYATPPPKEKNKQNIFITDIISEKEEGTSKVQSTPLDPNKQTCDVEKEGKMVMQGKTLSPNDKATVADVETLDNAGVFLEFNKGHNNSPITMLHTTKSGMMDSYKVIEWVYSELDCLKNKKAKSSRKVNT